MAEHKYSIIEKLDSGGMAEVWKGRAASMRGFEKLVAIKRVLPNLSKNEKFIAMFLDEARLSLHLNHANVVQTFDIGRSENSYFIVMEYVSGANLKRILELSREHGHSISPELCAFIGHEICKGLYHAHRRRDSRERPLNIVHRDVSPPNVLLSVEGEVKLVDFGLAKAATQAALTDPGIVKGKFSYLSPEAAYGEKVDFRADIFSTGIILWEMLAGVKLFNGRTDLETVKLVRRAKIPPLSDYRSQVPPDLEAIIRRALARQPRDRYQSARDLAQDLSRFLFNNRLMVTSFDVADLIARCREWSHAGPRPRRNTGSLVRGQQQAQIQEEMGNFTSLEKLAEMSFRPVATDAPGEAVPKKQEVVDPRNWTSELGLDHTNEVEVPEASLITDDTPVSPRMAATQPVPTRPVPTQPAPTKPPPLPPAAQPRSFREAKAAAQSSAAQASTAPATASQATESRTVPAEAIPGGEISEEDQDHTEEITRPDLDGLSNKNSSPANH
ncbi:MAG: serine/threonine protein kinase [Bradymonadia bacterium]